MSMTRRSLLGGSAAALGLLGAGALTGCSTSTAPKTDASAGASGGAATSMVMWMWPEGFGKAALANVKKNLPSVTLRQDVIGGDFKQKLTTTFTAKKGLPDITGVKGEDIAFFKSQADYFVDLNTLGAKDHAGDFLDWKWQQGTTTDGKLIGYPIDIGPTALFYRFDVFEKAGLPSEPAELAAAIKEWDAFLEMGKKLLAKLPGTYLVRNSSQMFSVARNQSGKTFIDESGTFIGDQDHIKKAWDLVVKALDAGIVAAMQSNTTDTAAAVNSGKLPADFGASWHLADLMSDAPATKGKWHVCAHPGAATNDGGSFLTIPQGAKDPAKSFEVIKTLLNDKNQALEFTDKGNFPSTPSSYKMPELTGKVDFLGGQVASEVFGEAAKTVRPLFEHPANSTVGDAFVAALELIENKKKTPDEGWKLAVENAKRVAKQAGVTVK